MGAIRRIAVEALDRLGASSDRDAQFFYRLLKSFTMIDAALCTRLLALIRLIDLVKTSDELLSKPVRPRISDDEARVVVLTAVPRE